MKTRESFTTKIAARDDFDPHRTREKRVLEIGGIIDAGT